MRRHHLPPILGLLFLSLAACDEAPPGVASRSAALVDPGSGARQHTTLAVGDAHVCVVGKTGAVWCWGRNTHGQLGDGTTTLRTTPVQVGGLGNVIAVAAGGHHTCAVLASGGVRCWGRNAEGQLGDASTIQRTTPVAVSGLADVVDLTAGGNHTCAVRAQGTAHCWGAGSYGQLGHGATTGSSVPVQVATFTDWAQLTAGSFHTCGLRGGGAVQCWGRGASGRLGTNSTANRSTPGAAIGMGDIRQVVAGASHTCALQDTGSVFCWGENNDGQLGDGSTTDRLTAVFVSGLTRVAYLAAGGHQTCAVRSENGGARCWGLNSAGQAGTGSTDPTAVLTPAIVTGLDEVTELELGASEPDNYLGTSCVVRAGGDLKCWGYGQHGQMGNGTTTFTNLAKVTPSLGQLVRSTIGLVTHGKTLLIKSDGTSRVHEWFPGGTPTPVAFPEAPRLVATHNWYSCALLADGRIQCWGDNQWGQLGDGTTTDRTTPVDVVGLDKMAMHIDVADLTSCAVLVDGTVRCWGAFEKGGDGLEPTFRAHLTPVAIVGLEDAAVQVGVAGESGCALLVDGRVSCWGPGGSIYRSTGSAGNPAKWTAGLTEPLPAPAIALASGEPSESGDAHCALLVNGTISCWGFQPGNGSGYSDVPVNVQLGSGNRAVAVDTSGDNGCAVMDDGNLRCWGKNDHGQLGQGFTGGLFQSPIVVPGMANIIAVTVGGGRPGVSLPNVCAMTASGQVYCWGAGFGSSPILQTTL